MPTIPAFDIQTVRATGGLSKLSRSGASSQQSGQIAATECGAALLLLRFKKHKSTTGKDGGALRSRYGR